MKSLLVSVSRYQLWFNTTHWIHHFEIGIVADNLWSNHGPIWMNARYHSTSGCNVLRTVSFVFRSIKHAANTIFAIQVVVTTLITRHARSGHITSHWMWVTFILFTLNVIIMLIFQVADWLWVKHDATSNEVRSQSLRTNSYSLAISSRLSTAPHVNNDATRAADGSVRLRRAVIITYPVWFHS